MSILIPVVYSEVDTYFEKVTYENTDDYNDNLGDVRKVVNGDVIADSLRNILRTKKTERVMLPEFGSNIDSILFEPMCEETASMIYHEVIDAIERWEDRVYIEKVEVSPDYVNQLYIVHIQFRMIIAPTDAHNLNIKLEI